MTIGDHPLSPSGVGIQSRYVFEALLRTGKYKIFSLGGAVRHNDYKAITTEEFGADWVIQPVNGYGNPDMIRSLLRTERPDVLWIMTDPRFYQWLWQMDNEIRSVVPIIYYHVWDNYPYPTFNKPYYESNDKIVAISKVTYDIVSTVAPEVDSEYMPHTADMDLFCKLPEEAVVKFKKEHFPDDDDCERVLFFWNNRNARRKQSGTLVYWFKEFLDQVGHDQARLIMHTDPFDPAGQDLKKILASLGFGSDDQNGIALSTAKVLPEMMAMMYNVADCTINISDAEGFGLSTFESLACETPIIVNMTGGLQEQVTNGEQWFGVGIEPNCKSVIGSQEIPWIYEDRICKDAFLEALHEIYNMAKEEREMMGSAGRRHVMMNYGMKHFAKRWNEIITETLQKHGSWSKRKNYKSWELMEMK